MKDEDGEYENSDGDEAPGDFSAWWVKFGGGFDYALTDNLYLRFEALYGLRLSNKAEDDIKDLFNTQFATMPDVSVETLDGHGLTAKLAVGYKF